MSTETQMDSEERVNEATVDLWKEKFSEDDNVYWPLLYPPMERKESLLVVGCNPAMPTKAYYEVPTFSPKLVSSEIKQDLINGETNAKQNYRYYRQHYIPLAKELRLAFEHVDMFFFRKTEQHDFKPLVTDRKGFLNDFGKAQVQLARRLIALTNPKAILVANAFAANHFKPLFGLEKLGEDGLYHVPHSGRSVPVFLSATFNGGALDTHSRERLIWHMRRTLGIQE